MAFPHKIDFRLWMEQTRTLMRKSQRRTGQYRYTQPWPEAEGTQAAFNSALHAIIYRWFDPEMAADELYSAFAGQAAEPDDRRGFIPAEWHWSSGEPTAQPALPLLAYAGVQVYHLTGDYLVLEKLYPRLKAFHDWLDARESRGVLPADATYAAFRLADLEAAAHISSDMAKHEDVPGWQARAEVLRGPLLTNPPDNVALALFSGLYSAAEAARLANETAPGYDLVDRWLLYMGLRRYELAKPATRIAEQTFRLVEKSGFFRRYDLERGEGADHPDYAAAGLVLDMLARERQGAPRGGQCV